MSGSSSKQNRLIVAAVFIVLEIAAICLLLASSAMHDIWIHRVSHDVIRVIWSGGETFRQTLKLKETNGKLVEENFRLREQIRMMTPSKEDNPENTAPKKDNGFTYVNATVVKISRNSQRNYIIINKGSEDGVRPFSGIISRKGIVGVVNSVGRHYSYGITFMNSKISASVRIGHGGPVSSLYWDGVSEDRALIKGRNVNSEDYVSDTVWTSGFSNIFPGDYPVGVVVGTRKVGGSYKDLEVCLFQSFDALQYVSVTMNPDSGEIDELEKKEEGSI